MKKLIYLTVFLLLGNFAPPALKAQEPRNDNVCIVYDAVIHCDKCVRKIENAIPFEKGVKDVEVDLENKQVTVNFDPSKTDLNKIQKAFDKIKVAVEAQVTNDGAE